jgi:hypothetical protein
MSTPVLAAPPPGRTTPTATPGEFLTGCALILVVPVAGLAGLLAGWALVTPALVTGWPAAAAAVAGWALVVMAWLRHRGWPAATAHLTAWAAPAAVLAPLASLGWLLPAGLVLWGPASAVFAIALAAVHRPALVGHAPRPVRNLPSGAAWAPGRAGCSG